MFPPEGILSPYDAAQTEPRDPRRMFRYWLMPQNPAGVRVTPENALQVSVVWACVDAITKAIAASEWNVFEKLKSGNRRLLIDDPLYYLLNVRPNEDMSAMNFREAMMIMALTWGNAYAEISYDLAGRAAALYPITPDKCELRRDPSDSRLIYHVWNDDGSEVDLERDEVLHIRGPGINGLMGDNVVAKAALSIGLTMALERFAATYFGNNTQIGGVLTVPGNLDDKTYNRLVEAFEARHRGPNKAHRPFIAEGGAEFKQSISNAEESQLVASRQYQISEICFVPGTKIVTPVGLVPIEQISTGQLVLTHRGRWRRVKHVMERDYVGSVVTAQAKGLDAVTATTNHPFYVQNVKPNRQHKLIADGDATWVDAGNLHPIERQADGRRARGSFHALTMPRLQHDFVLTHLDMAEWGSRVDGDNVSASKHPNATFVKRNPALDYDLGWLCGLFAADGSTSDHQAIFYIGAHEKEITGALRLRLDSVFGAKCTTSQSANVDRTVVSNKVLTSFFSEFGHNAHEKRLPGWCSLGGDHFKRGLIDGLIAGDGCYSEGYSLLRTTSTALAWQCRLLMWSLGINASIHTAAESVWAIGGRSGIAREIHTVQWRTESSRRGNMGCADGHVYFNLERADRSVYSGKVYNLEVEEDESYTTVGGAVHNCRYYGVPPHKVADLSRSTNNNIEFQGIEFTRDALRPWCKRNEQEVDFKLLSARGKARFTRIDIEWLSQGDAQARANYYQTMRNIGAYSVNDILKLEGRDTIGPEGDIRVVNSANIPLGEVGSNFIVANADDDKDDTPQQQKPSTDPSEAINSAWMSCFEQVYSRFASRLRNRMADYDRGSHTSEERDEYVRQFKCEQTKLLHDALVKPCQGFSACIGQETFSAALSAGQAVAFGCALPETAARELVQQFVQ